MGGEEVSAADMGMIRGALALYERWEGPIGEGGITIRGDIGGGERDVVIGMGSLRDLSRSILGEYQWRRMWVGLYLYFGKMVAHPERKGDAVEKLREMLVHIFGRMEWSTEPVDARERLLFEARGAVARWFGGVLPVDTGITGISAQMAKSSLTRWLRGDELRYSQRLSPSLFYTQIRSLLVGLGMDTDEIGDLIEEAVFEEREWEADNATACGRLLHTARREVARRFGGVLPGDTGIEGVSQQGNRAVLTRWINGRDEQLRYHAQFYSQVSALLIGCGMPPSDAAALISAARAEE
jgi:hypothetical protein